MAEVFLPTQPYLGMGMGGDRETSAPLPNPPFVFPVLPDMTRDTSSHARNLSNVDVNESRRTVNRSRPQRLSLNALPAFDFNPAALSPSVRPPSPSRSPTRRTPPPHHGHRRNGSEFVGGDTTNGVSVLMSTSPTKTDLPSGHRRNGSEFVGSDATTGSPVLVSPTMNEGASQQAPSACLGPPTTRRGHAHRRSGAISSHDLSMILKPGSDTKGGSAPTTPSDAMFQLPKPPGFDRSTSQPATATFVRDPSLPLSQPERPSPDGQPRPRVGFSDTIEFIPRPLSTISSETSSSMSTIRIGHSVSNSMTSIVSGGTSSPPSARAARSSRRSLSEHTTLRARAGTANAFHSCSSEDWEWDFSEPDPPARRPSSAPSGNSATAGAASPSGMSAWEGLKATGQGNSNLLAEPASSTAIPGHTTISSEEASGLPHLQRPLKSSASSPMVRPRTSPEPQVTKRQRKVKSWAGLLHRKAQQQEQVEELASRRSPTPPPRNITPEAEFSLDDMTFDEDTTCIIETGYAYPSQPPTANANIAAWKPREPSPPLDPDSSSSMLDLDAALGSMDLQNTGPAFEDVVGGFSGSMRRMHSSGTTGGFAGPGMHYHRRTESAPEMDAVERSRFGFPRLGSNPTMAIEEEEEEEDEEDAFVREPVIDPPLHLAGQDDYQASGLGVNIVEDDSKRDEPMQRRSRQVAKGAVEEHCQSSRALEDLIPEKLNSVDIVGADEEPRFSMVTKSSGESTITPTLSHDGLSVRPASAPIDFAMPTPTLSYGTSETPSIVSSPDFNRTSFDVPRMHTANSSITDRATLNSTRTGDLGDHALGMHSSVDDVPSLTSSASTMTSGQPPRFSSGANTCSSAERSSSFSAAVPPRTPPVSGSKRGSLVSLSKLVGSSYNKSKLNIEESAQPDIPVRTEKKKGNRISRLVKFWKSKEKTSPS
ncbi:hypothetical protein MMC28_000906 [Mycoblastus sanguinarius]|nr:hypothetical protein [Mycoblastus sanguinarius]